MASYNGKGRDRGNGLPITGIPSSASTAQIDSKYYLVPTGAGQS